MVGVEEEKDANDNQWTPINLPACKVPAKEDVKVQSDDDLPPIDNKIDQTNQLNPTNQN